MWSATKKHPDIKMCFTFFTYVPFKNFIYNLLNIYMVMPQNAALGNHIRIQPLIISS